MATIAFQNRVARLEQQVQELAQQERGENQWELVVTLAARVEKLEGELRALKARMGKLKESE